MKRIIYIIDPQCGWCYGNSESITAIKKMYGEKFEFELLVGGMWLGENAPRGGEKLHSYLEVNATRMSTTTGAVVGQAYYDLGANPDYTFSSLEPSAAIIAIKQLAPKQVFLFTKKLQEVLIGEGKRLDKLENYWPILRELSIDQQAFESIWMSKENIRTTNEEFKRAKSLANGFPTLILNASNTNQLLASGFFSTEAMINILDPI